MSTRPGHNQFVQVETVEGLEPMCNRGRELDISWSKFNAHGLMREIHLSIQQSDDWFSFHIHNYIKLVTPSTVVIGF